MTFPNDALYRLPDFEERARALTLRPYEWAFLLALDGRTAAVSIAQRLNIAVDVLADMVVTFEEHRLIAARRMTLDQFRTENTETNGVAPAPPAAAPQAPPKLAFSLKKQTT